MPTDVTLMVETGGWGGIGHYTHCLCTALAQAGHDICLVTHTHRYALAGYDKTYPVMRVFRGDAFSLEWRRLLSAVKQTGATRIHFQSILSSRRDWMVFMAARLVRSPYARILTVHNVIPHAIRDGRVFYSKRLYRNCSGLILHSAKSLDTLKALMGPNFNVPCAVIPPGHYGLFTRQSGLSRSAALDTLDLPDHRYMIFFGAIRRYKGIDNLLAAVAGIRDWPDDLRVLVAGKPLDDAFEQELLRVCHEANLDEKVVLRFSYVPESHIAALFEIADAVLLPYRQIDQSGVLLAAMGAGKSVIATPVGAFPETITPDFGFLAPDATVRGLTEAITRAISQRHRWQTMGARAAALATSTYGWPAIASRTIQFYHRLHE